MNVLPRPILIGYDGSAGAVRAIDGAGRLFAASPAAVVYVSAVPALHVHATSVAALREELIEEVRSAARHDAAAVAEEGARLARKAGLEATSRTVESADSPAAVIIEVAAQENVAAVVVGRTLRGDSVPWSLGSVSHRIVDHIDMPVVLV